MDVDILFLGAMFPKGTAEVRKHILSGMQDAANELQWSLVEGFLENECNSVRICSLTPVDSYPKHYDRPFVSKEEFKYSERESYVQIPFCNITLVKQIVNFAVCNKYAKEWAKKSIASQKVVVCYTENNRFARAAIAAKKKQKSVKVIQVIADLPEFMDEKSGKGLRKIYNSITELNSRKLRGRIDGFVLLTEQMKDKLQISVPHIVVEGIASEKEIAFDERFDKNEIESNIKTIVYTGTTTRRFGVPTLVKAFKLIKSNEYRLVICGTGDYDSELEKEAASDNRIVFMGRVSHDEALIQQSRATVLVNPRQNIGEYTKYSFPSKTMEYLKRGKPVIAYKLDGIPNDYDDYINYPKDNSETELAALIVDICEKPASERDEEGQRNKQFVSVMKNPKVQTAKILLFANEL